MALIRDVEEKKVGVQQNADLTLGDQWNDMPLGKDGALTHHPADLQGFINLLILSPRKIDFLLTQSQGGCLMHFHCMAPTLQKRESMVMTNLDVHNLILAQMSSWWDRAVETRYTNANLSTGYIGHILHNIQDCHPRGHTIRDQQALYTLDGANGAAEDDDDRAVLAQLSMPDNKCGRLLYHQGDRAQNTAGIPPFDNDKSTHGGWDKLPHSPQSSLPASVNPISYDDSFNDEKYKPEYTSDEATRQLQLEACSVYASYRVIRPWLRCLRASNASDVMSVCNEAKQSVLNFVSQFVMQTPPELNNVLAGGAWAPLITQDEDVRDMYYQPSTLRVSDDASFTPIDVWLPKNHSRWNVSSSEATSQNLLSDPTAKVTLQLCEFVRGTTRDDFGKASEDAGPYTDFVNPFALARLSSGATPCEEDQECVSGNCGGSLFGQDYCRCGSFEVNCTNVNSASTTHMSSSHVMLSAAVQLLVLFLAIAWVSSPSQ